MFGQGATRKQYESNTENVLPVDTPSCHVTSDSLSQTETEEPASEEPVLLLVCPLAPPHGGITHWSEQIMHELVRRGTPFKVINTSPRRRDIDGRTTFERIVIQGAHGLWQALRLLGWCLRSRTATVHVTTSGRMALFRDIAFLSVARVARAKSILHLHYGRVPELVARPRLEARLLYAAIMLASTTLVLDEPSLKALKRKCSKRSIIQVPNPINAEHLPPPRMAATKKVAYVGWVVPAKGIEVLLAAWMELHKDLPDWSLKLVGPASTEYLKLLTDRFSTEGLSFLGERPHEQAMRELNDADILVLPSYSEAFPNVILEAMALQKAVVASNVGAIPEVLQAGAGVVVAPGDPAALAEALKFYMETEEDRVLAGEVGGRLIHEIYSISKVVDTYCHHWRLEKYASDK